MNLFEAVKQSVTTRQAAEHYGIHIGRNGMACCPFHHDKTPSMKLDRRYHCFGCGADGDVIDFAAALYGLGKKEAAVQLAQDFGLSYEDWKPPGKVKKPKTRQKSPEEQFQEAKSRCFRTLADYLHLLMAWRTDYAPHSPEEAFHPRFVEALQKQAQVEYLLDVLLFGETEEKADLITDYGKDVIQLEKRMAELAAANAARTKKHHGERRPMNAICDTTAKSETLSVKGCKVKITYASADTDCLDAIQKLLQTTILRTAGHTAA